MFFPILWRCPFNLRNATQDLLENLSFRLILLPWSLTNSKLNVRWMFVSFINWLNWQFKLFDRLEKYIKLAKDNLGLEILPTDSFKSFIFSLTQIDKNDPERKFLCEVALVDNDDGSKKYSGKANYQICSQINRQFNCKMKCYLSFHWTPPICQVTTYNSYRVFKQKLKNRLKLCELFYLIHEMLQWKLNPIILF